MLSKWFYKFKIGRTITALHSLDDATLKDIGIHRSNIRSHAYEVFKNEKPEEDPLTELHNQYVKAGY
jgi:aminoglycoside phosphotransferase (APT) family kinase protein